MSATTTAQQQAREEIVLPPLRSDLVINKQTFEGRTFYIIKDPISLQYFRLSAEDYRLATLFDGKRTFRQIRETFIKLFPHVLLEYSEEELNERLLRFSNDLALLQFLSVQGVRLKQRYESVRARQKKKFSLYQFANKLFFARFSVFDPDVIFGRMARPLAWIWTRQTHWICVVLVTIAAFVFVHHLDRAEALMARFFTVNNLALMWVLTIIIKSIHELGHGLTCKHFGGEVHEVGAMMLVFTPYFFVNVSDCWVMPNRMHRVLISAAGIYVELVIASFATFAWALVQPGYLQMVLYNVIIIASVSTIFFNANPLMRFDGYYILTDLMEVPNLQTKSRALISYQVKKLLFGNIGEDPTLARMPLPKRRFWVFYIYAILSFLYGYWVIYKLTAYMAPHLKPYGLEDLSNFLSTLALVAWVIVPLLGFFKELKLNAEDWNPGGRLRRLLAIGAVAVGVLGLLCFWPSKLVIQRSLVVELANPETVRADVIGKIKEVYVHEGQIVPAGAPLALLENREVESQYAAAMNRVKTDEVAITQAMGADKPSDLREAQEEKTQDEAQLAQAKRDRDELVLRSKSGGTVLDRDLETRVGEMLRTGDLFTKVAPLAQMRIKVPLTEHEVHWVKKGQPVAIKLSAYPAVVVKGVIEEDPAVYLLNDIPAGLSERREGDVRTGLNSQGKEIPLDRTYEAVVEVENQDGVLRPGMTGRALVDAGRHPFGRLLYQSLLDLLSLDYRF